jgi:hypothetical protein
MSNPIGLCSYFDLNVLHNEVVTLSVLFPFLFMALIGFPCNACNVAL